MIIESNKTIIYTIKILLSTLSATIKKIFLLEISICLVVCKALITIWVF